MYKLPTQFDLRSSQVTESAAAGGSTSTTCSCCIVTLGVTSVLTSMHFASLEPAAKAAPSAEVVSTQLLDEPESAGLSKRGRSIFGFFLPLLSGLAGSVSFGIGWFAVWIVAFVTMYKKAGLSGMRGFWISAAALLAMALCVALEMALWLGLLK